MGLAKLELENGLAEVEKFLDGIYKKDDLANGFETWTEFEKYKRKQETGIGEFEFFGLFNRVSKLKMTLPPSVLAFKLLEKASLNANDRKLAFTARLFKTRHTM